MKMKILAFIFVLIIFLAMDVHGLKEVNLKSCEAPELPPSRGYTMPGTYSVFILLSLCGNHVEINDANTTYEDLPETLDIFFITTPPLTIDSVDIYVGKYQPCQPEFSAHTALPTALTAIARKMARVKRVRILRLIGVPKRNDQLIRSVSRSVDIVMLQNCDPVVLAHSLAEVQGCRKLGTLLVYGPSKFKDIWRALYGKKELVQVHLEQDSGSQDAFGLNELMKTLPKLRSIILRCDDSCRTNFTKFAKYAKKKTEGMTIVSFRTDTQPIDSAGLEVSKNLGSNLISLTLRGSRPIRCENFAQIVANLLRIKKTDSSNFDTMYLNAEGDCRHLNELWGKTAGYFRDGELGECLHPLPDCKRVNNSSVQLQ